MIDTHSHIYSEEFDADRAEVIAAAKESGVEQVVLANVDSSTIEQLTATGAEYPDFFRLAMGLHPTSVKEDYLEELERIISQFSTENRYVAVGEIGLDLYWDKTFISEQVEAFHRQVEVALELRLPVIIHVRKAYSEVFEALKRYQGSMPRGVFHCFSGGVQEAQKAVELGFYLGIGGVVTYKNSNLGEIIKPISMDRILTETDAPYLSPVPYRGKRNEPKYMAEVCRKLAEIYGCSYEEMDRATTRNAKELFGLN